MCHKQHWRWRKRLSPVKGSECQGSVITSGPHTLWSGAVGAPGAEVGPGKPRRVAFRELQSWLPAAEMQPMGRYCVHMDHSGLVPRSAGRNRRGGCLILHTQEDLLSLAFPMSTGSFLSPAGKSCMVRVSRAVPVPGGAPQPVGVVAPGADVRSPLLPEADASLGALAALQLRLSHGRYPTLSISVSKLALLWHFFCCCSVCLFSPEFPGISS